MIRCQQIQGSLKIIDGPFSIYRKEYDDTSSGFYGILLQSFQFTVGESAKKDLCTLKFIFSVISGSTRAGECARLRENMGECERRGVLRIRKNI